MTLQPNFLPVGSVVYYNIESIEYSEWTSSSCIFPCDVCNGSKIITMFVIKP